jgi:hypothetical protein
MCEHTPDKHVIIVWRHVVGLRSHHDRIFQEVTDGIEAARKTKRRMEDRFGVWCDVEIYHSPESGVMKRVE